MASIERPNQPLCELRDTSAQPKRPYPPISSIPPTPDSRLRAPPTTATSVLYLAYGSNLCAETLLGVRRVRPLSQVNVSVPTLDLVFGLPGLPYTEPCFANTALRKVPGLPDPSKPPKIPPITPPFTASGSSLNDAMDDRLQKKDARIERGKQPQQKGWTHGLFGVVYEVTHEDYATIIATEGTAYTDILIPCFPLAPRMGLPEKPPIDVPKPFLAHTLLAPAIPDAPDGGNGGIGVDTDSDSPDSPEDPRKKWYWRFIRPHFRPDPDYAQPSARYLKLIKDGAREHELPEDYQEYLQTLQPYRVTNWKQEVAKMLIGLAFGPFLIVSMLLARSLADKKGRAPLWLVIFMGMVLNLVWAVYDAILKPVFGDGERTQKEGTSETYTRNRWTRMRPPTVAARGYDEEKLPLCNDGKLRH
ncbi:hypothetical protein SODALDRAFT_329041 [Sodiomyces alkalinus F11]|uniref:gamma-glutamylcyclotransferase n=1 Tax=Sodiomyces alkalinus (strain CBS 110278 / VKM F-3762 / F11) TaxID=1314773 RepID=A0A3N2PMA7_SODAK|nr:hypothetical protein SODALDRAFT_329041 [Sodiomyces alkalinus F11]ROT35672.1 hypothetical protein SODALDRAFT_329041 [Sodiomyces alkalinus F11]